jgi:hypothetical protein
MNFPIHQSGREVIKAWKLERTDEWLVKLENSFYLVYSPTYGYYPEIEQLSRIELLDIFIVEMSRTPDYHKEISRFRNLL